MTLQSQSVLEMRNRKNNNLHLREGVTLPGSMVELGVVTVPSSPAAAKLARSTTTAADPSMLTVGVVELKKFN